MIKYLDEIRAILVLAKDIQEKTPTTNGYNAIKQAKVEIKYRYSYGALIAKKVLSDGSNSMDRAIDIVDQWIAERG